MCLVPWELVGKKKIVRGPQLIAHLGFAAFVFCAPWSPSLTSAHGVGLQESLGASYCPLWGLVPCSCENLQLMLPLGPLFLWTLGLCDHLQFLWVIPVDPATPFFLSSAAAFLKFSKM